MTTMHDQATMVVGGERVPAADGGWIETLDPATGQPLAQVPRGTAEDVDRAVAAAHAAQPAWGALAAAERGRLVQRIGARILEARDELARLESLDTGKPLRQALADVDSAARYFEFYGGLADKVRGTTIPLGADYVDYTVREPVGVSGQIVPWNYPMQIGCRGIAPALAAGNGVVVKPAEDAPLSLLRLAELALEEQLPPGLLNVVTGLGPEAGAALAAHRRVNQITFTGSVATGIAVAQAAAAHVAPVTLELGGKCPNLVFDDADIDTAVPVLLNAIVQNAGQTCSAATRLIVSAAVRDELVERLTDEMRAVSMGRGVDDPQMGPLISAAQRQKVAAFVDRAAEDGATVLAGGRLVAPPGLEDGFFYPATLVDGVSPASAIARDEVFGPVLTVLTFTDEREAVTIANSTDYGLVCGVWTGNVGRAHRVAGALSSGQVFVNGYGAAGGVELPFGGYGHSGYGREKGIEGIESYLQTKNVCVRVGA
jgi:acyl-CoA reductase-like NAD-dependent aldehyde dehydrogenase